MKHTYLVAAALAAGMVFSSAASAIFIDFEQGAATGGMLACEDSQCTGTDIPFLLMKADTVGDGKGDTFADADTLLNFSTEANTISLTGTVEGFVTESATLLEGTFTEFNFGETRTTDGQVITDFFGKGLDNKYLPLVEALGLPTDTEWQFLTFQFASTAGVVTSADIKNVPVPEPGTLGLLGLGLAALAFAVRRRQRGSLSAY